MIRGALDFIDHNEVRGWAQDERSPHAAVSLLISDNRDPIGRVSADGFRADLKEAGIGDGRHAFEFRFPAGLTADSRHVIHICTDDGTPLPGSPAVVEASTPATSTAIGNLDVADRSYLAGWCQYDGGSQDPVSLIITVNGQLVGRVIANLFREDLQSAGIGRGRHAFNWTFAEPLSLTEKQVIRVWRELDGLDLPGSPVTLDPPPEFDGTTQAAISNLLARYQRPEEIEQKITFLAAELDRLVQSQADLNSGRQLRQRNRDLARRWGRHQVTTAPKGPKPRALVIDDRIPALGRDAGSNAIVSHIRSLQRLGYEVSFIASAELRPRPGMTASEDFQICGLPFYGSIEELLWRQAGEFDLIYLHRISNAAKYGELVRHHFPKARKVFSVADLHHVRISRQAEVEDRPELLGLAKRLEFAELLAAASADVVITHSDYEAEILRKKLPKANIHRVLWSVPPKPVETPFSKRKGIAFIGGFEHAPNVDAAKWLMSSLMPRIRQRDPKIQCYLVGSGFPSELAEMKSEGITVTGAVEDLSEIFNRVRLTIAPLSYGAGVKGKIMESLAAGIPCIHTEIAGEGMGLPQELDICRGDGVEALADAVRKLHRSSKLTLRCREAGLKYVENELSEQKLDDAMALAIGPTPHILPEGQPAAVPQPAQSRPAVLPTKAPPG